MRYVDGKWTPGVEVRSLNDPASDAEYACTIQRMDLQKVVELVYVALCVCGDQTIERFDLYRSVWPKVLALIGSGRLIVVKGLVYAKLYVLVFEFQVAA